MTGTKRNPLDEAIAKGEGPDSYMVVNKRGMYTIECAAGPTATVRQAGPRTYHIHVLEDGEKVTCHSVGEVVEMLLSLRMPRILCVSWDV